MNSFCPVCDRPISQETRRCRCGWIRKIEPVHTPVDLGPQLAEHTRRAEEWCLERGLDTTEKKIAYCRRVMALLSRPRTVADMRQWMDAPKSELARKYADEVRAARFARMPARDPGQDDEELAA